MRMRMQILSGVVPLLSLGAGVQQAAHLVLSFLLIGPAASFLVAVMVHSLPTGRFQIFSQVNVRTAVLAGGHCTGLWCLPVAAVCCRSPCCAYLSGFALLVFGAILFITAEKGRSSEG